MGNSSSPETGSYYTEITKPITLREFEAEKARLDQLRTQALRPSWRQQMSESEPVNRPFSTRLDWSKLAVRASRSAGVRLILLGIAGDTVTDSNRIDLDRYIRVIVQHVVPPNTVEYMVKAADMRLYQLFKDVFEIDLDIALFEGKLSITPPRHALGFRASSRIGRWFAGNTQGSDVS